MAKHVRQVKSWWQMRGKGVGTVGVSSESSHGKKHNERGLPSSSCVHTKTGGLKLEMGANKRREGRTTPFSASHVSTTTKKRDLSPLPVLRRANKGRSYLPVCCQSRQHNQKEKEKMWARNLRARRTCLLSRCCVEQTKGGSYLPVCYQSCQQNDYRSLLRVVASKKHNKKGVPSSSCVRTKTGGLKLEIGANKRREGRTSPFATSHVSTTKNNAGTPSCPQDLSPLPVLRRANKGRVVPSPFSASHISTKKKKDTGTPLCLQDLSL
jgi:hypothetical protein